MLALRANRRQQDPAGAHAPVMCHETLDALVSDPDGVYVDATFGRGGHSAELLNRLSSTARVVALDRDPEAVACARELAADDPRLTPVHARFSSLSDVVQGLGQRSVVGVLMDLGVSSPQLESAVRGFSFMRDGPLDMRMDPQQGQSAAEWLNSATGHELERVIRNYGEEIHARAIVQSVLDQRPVHTTSQLNALIDRAVRVPDHRKHTATRVFQAIRIHINDELTELSVGLDKAFSLLDRGGRLAVLSFHSLEHRIVRRRFRGWVRPELPHKLPVQGSPKSKADYVVKGCRPAEAEICANRRARSAHLQVVARVQA